MGTPTTATGHPGVFSEGGILGAQCRTCNPRRLRLAPGNRGAGGAAGGAEGGGRALEFVARITCSGHTPLTRQLLLGVFTDEEAAVQKVKSRCPRLAGRQQGGTGLGLHTEVRGPLHAAHKPRTPLSPLPLTPPQDGHPR